MIHITQKRCLSREEKKKDRQKVDDNLCVRFDLQAVMQSPNGNTPLSYPKKGRLSEFIDQCHELTYHGGAKLTSGFIRQKYWLVGGLKATKKRIFQYVKCRKHTPRQHYQIMGDLSTARVNLLRLFYHTGVDYTSHVFVKANKGRGILTMKGYVAVFVCMVTKAVPSELVSDLTTSSFLAALRRMTARQGVPKKMYSDQGTTFIGANKVLQEE